MKATLILPTYNQYDSLMIVLKHLRFQDIDPDVYEVIIVDDGSSDQTRLLKKSDLKAIFDGKINILHLNKNCGRSVARNIGIEHASTDILIFCDSDRIPHSSFIRQHIECHELGKNVVIGASYEYFGRKEYLNTSTGDWNIIEKYSRLPFYYRKVMELFHDFRTNSPVAWATLLIGNSSIKRSLIQKSGGFNPLFQDWGLEHFELGIRLREIESFFYHNPNAKNYHIPHARATNFYDISIKKSLEILVSLHPNIDRFLLYEFLTTDMNIEIFEKRMQEISYYSY